MVETTEEMIMDMEESSSMEDIPQGEMSDPKAGQIVAFVKERYYRAETARYTEENRWLQAYRNYRGLMVQTYNLLLQRNHKYSLR